MKSCRRLCPPGTATATFEYSSNEQDVTYECSLDHGNWEPCNTPDVLTGLQDGAHHLDVRAKDRAGNVDPTPAGYDWTVGDGGSGSTGGTCATVTLDYVVATDPRLPDGGTDFDTCHSICGDSPPGDTSHFFGTCTTAPDGACTTTRFTVTSRK